MDEKLSYDYSSTCVLLDKTLADLDYKIRLSEQNKKLSDTYNERIAADTNVVNWCNYVKRRVTPLVDDIEKYLNQKKKDALVSINNSIRVAASIVQDSMDDIRFEIDEDRGEAYVATSEGLDVQLMEGSGFKSIVSTFIRSVVMNSRPEILHTMTCDEIFSQVSVEYSAMLSSYLHLICETSQVISIEQKSEIYSNIDIVEYRFEKHDDYSVVTRIDRCAGDELGIDYGDDEEEDCDANIA